MRCFFSRLFWGFLWDVFHCWQLLLFFFLLGCCTGKVFAQPAWLGGQDNQDNVVAPVVVPKPKIIIKKDTVKVVVNDTVVRIDTVLVLPENKKYKYKLQVCNLDYNRVFSLKVNLISFDFYKDILDNLNNEEKMKNCYFSSTYSDTNYVYSYGIENVRSNGFIYDNYGNKLEQTEKILTGITLRVKGDNVSFDYLENKKLMLQNTFNDGQVNFYADYSLFEYRCNFWIFCNNTQKKQYIFLNLTREAME